MVMQKGARQTYFRERCVICQKVTCGSCAVFWPPLLEYFKNLLCCLLIKRGQKAVEDGGTTIPHLQHMAVTQKKLEIVFMRLELCIIQVHIK